MPVKVVLFGPTRHCSGMNFGDGHVVLSGVVNLPEAGDEPLASESSTLVICCKCQAKVNVTCLAVSCPLQHSKGQGRRTLRLLDLWTVDLWTIEPLNREPLIRP